MMVKENINTWITHLRTEDKLSISVDCVIFGFDEEGLKVLLIDCNMPPYVGKKSLLGDLVNSNESLEQAAIRVMKKRTTLTNLYFDDVKAYSAPDRHPLGRVISVAYYSFIKISDYKIQDTDGKHLGWIPIDEIDNLAFDHNQILTDAFRQLKRKIKIRPILFSLLPEKFTLIQLQHLYETVLQTKLDRRNFRRKLISSEYLIDLNEMQNNVAHRPAKLYQFDFEKYKKQLKSGDSNFVI